MTKFKFYWKKVVHLSQINMSMLTVASCSLVKIINFSHHLYIKCVPVLLQTTFTVQLDLNSFNLTEQKKTVAYMNR